LSSENRISSVIGKPFGTVESFKLCTEGLRALERYEREPLPADLRVAEARFEECVRKYPAEILPRFYLGSVKTLRGYAGLDEAVSLLKTVVDQGTEDLRLVARFNLASAYIEKYDSFDEAEKLLHELEDDAGSVNPEQQRMVWWSRAILLYIDAHRIWETRKGEQHDQQALDDLDSRFETFQQDLEQTPFRNDALILAECWNVKGTLIETRAYFEPDRSVELGEEAKAAFLRALSYKPVSLGYRENIARVYGDILKDRKTAIELWKKLLDLRPDGHYIHYNLGKLYYELGDRAAARKHLALAAPKIDKAEKLLKKMEQEDSEGLTPATTG